MEEIWKKVIGYEESYEVSNLGNVRSFDRYIKCKKNNSGVFTPKKKRRDFMALYLTQIIFLIRRRRGGIV